MTRTIPALILLLMFPSFSFTKQVVTFPSGSLRLHGIVFRPEGKGPFPAVVYNHGSYKDPTEAIEILGPVFASRAVSYTHLDVYKRQTPHRARTGSP